MRIHLKEEDIMIVNQTESKTFGYLFIGEKTSIKTLIKIKKQILSDQRKIEKEIKLKNSKCKECKEKYPLHDSSCSKVAYHPLR